MTTEAQPSIDLQAQLDDAQLLLYRDRRRAHATLFGGTHRKSHATPAFHWEMIDDFHNPDIRNLLQIAFRGAAKSTLGEEGTAIKALFREFRYCLIVSSVSDIACMRLHAIKKQFEANESVLEIFGPLKSRPWEDDHIELASGIVFRAVGRGQAIRGGKDEDSRPDFVLLDDIEDFKAVANETQIKKTLSWFDGELVGSADAPNLRMRMLANDMGPDCLANKLKNSGEWTTRVYPWIVGGRSIWEDRYPLKASLAKRADMYQRGSGDEYEREYMCNSTRPEARTFRDEMLKTEMRVRVYEPVNAMLVPAPMTESALHVAPTACAVWSWIGDKCVVWECWSKNLQTNDIVSEAQRIDAMYRPVKLGITKDAYADWAHASMKLPAIVPVKETAEPLDFIRALQPWFVGKHIVFAQEPGDAWGQFIAFPNGPKDIPHALAFALHPTMRGGQVVFEDFGQPNIAPDLMMEPGPVMLALNADESRACGVLCQVSGKGLRVFYDWMRDGDPAECGREIIQSANLMAQRRCTITVPLSQFDRGKDRFTTELRKIGIVTSAGGTVDDGRREMRRLLREQAKGFPRLLVSDQARWTMNAFLAGYTLADDPTPYKLIGEAIESLAALMSLGEFGDDRTNATSRDGRPYISVRPVKEREHAR